MIKNHHLVISFMLNLIVISFSFPIDGYWIKSNGPEGGPIQSIIFRGDIVYCGGVGGLYRSTDSLKSWEFVGLEGLHIREMAQDDKYIYIGGYYGCYRYDPKLDVFDKIFEGTTQTIVLIDSILLIGTDYYPGIYRSTNHGRTLEESNEGIDNYDIEKMFVTSQKTILASAMGAAGLDVFRSVDGGLSWKRIDTNPSAWAFADIGELYKILYAYKPQNYAKVWLSYDDGLTWQIPPGATAPSDHILALHVDPTGLYVSSAKYGTDTRGIFKSNNIGRSWKQINEGILNGDIFFITRHGNYHYLGGQDGVYVKPVNSEKWERRSNGLLNTTIHAIEYYQGKLFIATHGLGLQASSDNGKTWQKIDLPEDRLYVFDVHPTGDHLIVIASKDPFYPWYGMVYLSSDGGKTWKGINNGFDTGLIKRIVGNEKFLVAVTEYGLFVSWDLGDNWQKITNGVPHNFNASDAAVMDSIAILINGTSSVLRTEDYGRTWQSIYVRNLSGECAAIIGKNFYVGNGMVNHVFESTDLGMTWHELKVPLFNARVQDFAGDGKHIFVALSGGGGVIASSDSGKHWSVIDRNLTLKNVYSLLYKNGILYAGTYGGSLQIFVDTGKPVSLLYPSPNSLITKRSVTFIWKKYFGVSEYRFQLAENPDFKNLVVDVSVPDTFYFVNKLKYNQEYYYRVSIVTPYWNNRFSPVVGFRTAPPKDFILEQNYPNPFNESTSIIYHVPRKSQVKIAIYDVLGREAETLVDQISDAGTYQINFNASNLTSGIYFYILEAPNTLIAKKMLLVK